MGGKLRSVRPAAWWLLIFMGVLGVGNILAAVNGWVPAGALTYTVQPAAAIIMATLAWGLTHGQKEHIRHAGDKAIIVGSVIAIWFCVYFATGIITTYVSNALVSSVQGVLLNIFGFGATAAAIELTRHRTIALAGRRNAIWFGVLVAVIFALCQLNLTRLAGMHELADVVKMFVSDIIPTFVASMVLTYLAIACGLQAQLAYSLGSVAMAILPPIIPKYDWYLLGVSSILLAIIVYLVVDHSQQERHTASRHHNTHRAFDIMWVVTMVTLILFMTGALTYKPSAIMSDSMAPTFRRGSMVIVQKLTNPMDINISDIIQYEAHDTVITHRVIVITQADDGSGKRTFITKGDNNPSRDEPVSQDHVTGVVRAQIPYIGYPTVWLHEITVGNKSNEINK